MSEDAEKEQKPAVRTGQGSTKLTRAEFEQRWNARFYDPAFDVARSEIKRLVNIAWDAYEDARKSPRTRKAGAAFANPEHELSIRENRGLWRTVRSIQHSCRASPLHPPESAACLKANHEVIGANRPRLPRLRGRQLKKDDRRDAVDNASL